MSTKERFGRVMALVDGSNPGQANDVSVQEFSKNRSGYLVLHSNLLSTGNGWYTSWSFPIRHFCQNTPPLFPTMDNR